MPCILSTLPRRGTKVWWKFAMHSFYSSFIHHSFDHIHPDPLEFPHCRLSENRGLHGVPGRDFNPFTPAAKRLSDRPENLHMGWKKIKNKNTF